MAFRTRVRVLDSQLESLTWNSTVQDADTLALLELALAPVEKIAERWYSEFWSEADE